MPNELSKELFIENVKSKVLELIVPYFGNGASSIYERSSLLHYLKGEKVITEGEEGSDMFILISGSLNAFINKDNTEVEVGFITAGECVGEMALLGNSVRSASIRCRRNSLLLKISRSTFLEVNQEQRGESSIELSKTLIKRLKRSNLQVRTEKKHSKFIALVDVNGHMDMRSFEEKFTDYWGNERKVKVLHSSDIQQLDEIQLALRINELESFDYVLMSASDSQSAELVASNSDKTVYFASEADHDKIKSLNFNILNHDELVLAYTDTPKDLSSWFSYFPPERIFKFHIERQDHLERVIRLISETAICLVLGGGGAHGLSIIGVVKALNEAGIPIDTIGGTSIGSIMGSAFAMDWPFDDIYKKVEYDISKHNPLNDYTWPFVSLIKGNKMKKVLKKHFDLDIELCWKNLFIVAANLSTASTEVMNTGPLDRSIASSIAIPGILPPQLFRKSLLIDGGVLNNLPADIMRNRYNGHIISVDVVSSKSRVIEHKYRLNNWQLIKNTFTGNRKNYVPNTMSTLMKAVTLASAERSTDKEAVSAIYLRPRIKKGFLAWKEMDAFVTEGYEVTKNYLDSNDVSKILSIPKKFLGSK